VYPCSRLPCIFWAATTHSQGHRCPVCISLPEQLAIGPEMCQDAWGNFSAAFAGKAPSSVESR